MPSPSAPSYQSAPAVRKAPAAITLAAPVYAAVVVLAAEAEVEADTFPLVPAVSARVPSVDLVDGVAEAGIAHIVAVVEVVVDSQLV